MDKKQLIELLMERLPDDAMFEMPNFEVEGEGDLIGHENRGFDHHGFTVVREIRNQKGNVSINYRR